MNRRSALGLLGAGAATFTACSMAPLTPSGSPGTAGPTEVLWLGQSCFRITTPGGKVIVIDPWLIANPQTPPAYKKLEALGRVDAVLVTHAHADHYADAPALALMNNAPLRAPGDLNATLVALGVLPATLAPRFNKGGTVMLASRLSLTAVHADHSSTLVWRNPATGRDETHAGGEPVGYVIELENGYRIYHAGDTAVFGDMKYIGERYRPDLAMVPIGGNFTMDPQDAAHVVRTLLKPKIAIPMHYGTNPLALGTAAEFVQAMGDSPVKVIVAEPGRALFF